MKVAMQAMKCCVKGDGKRNKCTQKDLRNVWSSSLPEKIGKLRSFSQQLFIGLIIHVYFVVLFGYLWMPLSLFRN